MRSGDYLIQKSLCGVESQRGRRSCAKRLCWARVEMHKDKAGKETQAGTYKGTKNKTNPKLEILFGASQIKFTEPNCFIK